MNMSAYFSDNPLKFIERLQISENNIMWRAIYVLNHEC